ncbi:DUF2269 domain-containing protein [Bacillus horti]|uniref:Membrane protein n=1 Tax=Caldalkalibacillus horti TaxID=77523 RepID=A0ABT9W0W8_9BACI|nr:DUF2269 domain-containing protein [Bacillus horti]MDQ0166745.1 putative membrane protein [Bacillus horti]
MKILIFLHVLGAVMFLGNVITAAFWKIRAERGKDIAHIHKAVKNVMFADYVFTLPGIILLIITGNLMAFQAGYAMMEWNWVTVSQGLFILTGLLWVIILLPNQRKMIKESEKSISLGQLTPSYKKASRIWDVCGSLANLIPLVVLYLMLAKPF